MFFGLAVPYLTNKRNEEKVQKSLELIEEWTNRAEKQIVEFTRDAKQQINDWESTFEKKDTIESSEPSAKTDCLSDRTKEAYRLYEEKRFSEAAEIFKLLSSEGNSAAQNSLGDMYYYGYGVEKDYNEARIQYELSAKQGNRDALYNLGIMYLNGIGVNVSMIQATKYFV